VPKPRTTKPFSRYAWLLSAATLTLLFSLSPLGAVLNRLFLDSASRHPFREVAPPVGSAILLIDDLCMSELGREPYSMRWPLPRGAFAGLLLALNQAGAKQIVMDFTFVDQSESAEQDLLLAGVAAACRPVVLASMPGKEPVFWDAKYQTLHKRFFDKPRTGLVDFAPDEDGMLRHYRWEHSLASRTLPGASQEKEADILRWYGGLEQLKQSGVPVLSAGAFVKVGLGLIDRVTELAPELNPEAIEAALASLPPGSQALTQAVQGKTVFVGASAHGTYDSKHFPVGELEPGVLAHWTAWADASGAGFIRPLSVWLVLGSAFSILAGLWLFSRRQEALLPLFLISAILLVSVLGTAYALLSFGLFFAPATPSVSVLLGLGALTTDKFLLERQRKREVQSMFGSYVDPGVVRMLIKDPSSIQLGGEKRELTVLFADLAGFTDLSERIPPELLLSIINRYLQEVSDALLNTGAYIDKYIGDAVMAVWGAPGENLGHAQAACEGALAAQEALARLREEIQLAHGCSLHMRIGVNTGNMIVGNLGSEKKRNYTVLGDPVNLASRLEAANKDFGTAILLGHSTALQVRDRFATRPLTRLQVKGKHEAIEVHELCGRLDSLTPETRAFLSDYESGYRDMEARRFEEALKAFSQARQSHPADKMTEAWHLQCSTYVLTAPPDNWIPLIKLTTK